MKFKAGDTITATTQGMGFELATVTGIIKKNGRQYYTLNIVNGIATIPITAEKNYEIAKTNKHL